MKLGEWVMLVIVLMFVAVLAFIGLALVFTPWN